VQRLFAVGAQRTHAVESFGAGGEWFADATALIARVQAELVPGVTVLVKGSRVNRLERVVQALMTPADAAGPAAPAAAPC
jgi:UDP-N-acetylmuramoyl-tripeptide--D-alanyl-D-alanine ligase